jgi:hypothetical protein
MIRFLFSFAYDWQTAFKFALDAVGSWSKQRGWSLASFTLLPTLFVSSSALPTTPVPRSRQTYHDEEEQCADKFHHTMLLSPGGATPNYPH